MAWGHPRACKTENSREERRQRQTLPAAACLASPRRAPGNLGHRSQALSAPGAKARAGPLVPAPGPSPASGAQPPPSEPRRRAGTGNGASVRPGGLTSWSSLALIAPAAGRPPGGRLRPRESESSGPVPGASPFRPWSAEGTPLAPQTRVTRAPGLRAARSRPRGVCGRGARGRGGWGAGAVGETLRGGAAEAPPPPPSCSSYWLLLSPPLFPTPVGDGRLPTFCGAAISFGTAVGVERCHSGAESASCAGAGGYREVWLAGAGSGAVAVGTGPGVLQATLPASLRLPPACGDRPQLQRARGVRPG